MKRVSLAILGVLVLAGCGAAQESTSSVEQVQERRRAARSPQKIEDLQQAGSRRDPTTSASKSSPGRS